MEIASLVALLRYQLIWQAARRVTEKAEVLCSAATVSGKKYNQRAKVGTANVDVLKVFLWK